MLWVRSVAKMTSTVLFVLALVLGAEAQGGRVNLTTAVDTIGNLLTGDNFSRMTFILYTNSTQSDYRIANAGLLPTDPSFDAAKPTALYMHGFQENRSSPSVGNMSSAFLQRGSHNVVALDWGDYVAGNGLVEYIAAFLRVPAAGEAVAAAVKRMVAAGLRADSLWMIGHSLGGQLAGNTAKNLDFKPTRITGLDPAGPGFAGDPEFPQLGAEDADVVDVVHTDAGVFGYPQNDGSIDFWPNGGHREQPGCTSPPSDLVYSLLGCSHSRSWWFFAESVVNDTAFPAVRCASWLDFQTGSCPPDDGDVAYMGFAAAAANLTGTFYLRTGSEEPFGLGAEGLHPAPS